jgi:hypothetical protein
MYTRETQKVMPEHGRTNSGEARHCQNHGRRSQHPLKEKTMSDPRKLPDGNLVDWVTNASTGVASGKITGLLAVQNTAISDALTDKNAVFAANNLAVTEAEAAFKQAKSDRDDTRDELLGQISDLKSLMESVNSDNGEYDVIGFDPPDNTRSVVVPQTPTDLTANGYANGENRLKWVTHNNPGSVNFMVEAKVGDTDPYIFVGTTRAQRWTHKPVVPGQFYQYRVRAQSARGEVSGWSNEVVVYGTQP